jgi:hypothetical protein
MGAIGDDVSGPCKVQAPIVDVSTGYIGALAVLAALMTRATTGRGLSRREPVRHGGGAPAIGGNLLHRR